MDLKCNLVCETIDTKSNPSFAILNFQLPSFRFLYLSSVVHYIIWRAGRFSSVIEPLTSMLIALFQSPVLAIIIILHMSVVWFKSTKQGQAELCLFYMICKSNRVTTIANILVEACSPWEKDYKGSCRVLHLEQGWELVSKDSPVSMFLLTPLQWWC